MISLAIVPNQISPCALDSFQVAPSPHLRSGSVDKANRESGGKPVITGTPPLDLFCELWKIAN